VTELLKRTLREVADEAPVSYVPSDLWAQGQRSRTRRRVAGVSAMVGALALVAGALAVGSQLNAELTPATAPSAAGSGKLSVPRQLYAPPEWMFATAEKGQYPPSATADFELGPVAAVFDRAGPGGAPVAVSATDGGYHLLALPVSSEAVRRQATGGEQWLALSPDGAQLAFAVEPSKVTPTGVIGFVDFLTGDTRLVPTQRSGTAPATLAWSPNARWLFYVGSSRQLSAGPRTGSVWGLIDTKSLTVVQEMRADPRVTPELPIAVTNDGAPVFGSANMVDGTGKRRLGYWLPSLRSVGSTGPMVALAGRAELRDTPRLWRPGKAPALARVDELRLDFQGGWTSDPLGWVPPTAAQSASAVYLLAEKAGDQEKTVVLLGGDRFQNYTRVVDVEPAIANLSVATNLLSAETSAQTVAEPDWPTPPTAGPTAGPTVGPTAGYLWYLLAGILVVASALVVVLRRRISGRVPVEALSERGPSTQLG
jgi:hypothetical protein